MYAVAVRVGDLLPWRDFVIETSWPCEVAALELRKAIDEPQLFSGEATATFVGRAESATRFKFTRRVPYRSTWRLVVLAVVEPSRRDGARIRVRMRMHLFVVAFATAWRAAVTYRAASTVAGAVFSGRMAAADVLPLALPFFGVAITCVPFALEASKIETLLRGIYAAAPAAPPPPDTGDAYR